MSNSQCYINTNSKHSPSFVYKYRDAENSKHIEAFRENYVYLASPDTFEDKQDCKYKEYIPKTCYDFYLYHLQEYNKFYFSYNRKNHTSYAKDWANKHFIKMQNDPIGFDKVWEELNEERIQKIGVLSLSGSPRNEKCWEKHGAMHSGFCIEYDQNKLFETIKGASSWVNYVNELPVYDGRYDDLKGEYNKKYFTKLKEYAWENEFRIIKSNPRGFQRNIYLTKDCVKAIYLGKNMKDSNREEIIKIVKEQYNDNVLIY
ncbi:MAG: hypothetical protein MJ069_07695 [Salinivirgaceae bacterium]|nr:hypothetical protein [Salinivirgaceae bacterium]